MITLMHARQAPFQSSSLAALRLLTGFVLTAEEAAPRSRRLLAQAGADNARPCQALLTVLCAVRRRSSVRSVLDRVLAASLGREAERFERLSADELERCWRERRDSMAGPELAALLWQVARREQRGLRRLESEIADACTPRRLLSREQRELDPILHATVRSTAHTTTLDLSNIQGDLDAA